MKRILLALALLTLGASAPPSFVVLNTAVSDSATFAMVEVDKSAKASSYSTIRVTTVDGTARAGVDYTAVDRSQTVANNTLYVRIPVPIIARPGYQGTRQFKLHLAVTRYGTVRISDAIVTITDSEPPPPPPPAVKWSFCAVENGTCYVSGTAHVRYGKDPTWSATVFNVTGSVQCSNSWFGDPLPGTVKECQTDGVPVAAPPPPPPPPPVQCPDGTTIPAGQTCPVVNPPPAGWVAAPLRAGGFARVTSATDPTWDVTGPGNGRKLVVGEVVALYTNGWGENYDGRISYAIHAMSDGGDGRAWEGSLEGVAPTGTPPTLPADWYAGSLATANKTCAGAWSGTNGVTAGILYRVTMTVGSWAKIPTGQPGYSGATWYAVPSANPYLGALSVVTGDCLTGQ